MSVVIPAPMLATPGGLPFTSPDWLYEIKFDGYRCIARVHARTEVELRTKSGTNCTTCGVTCVSSRCLGSSQSDESIKTAACYCWNSGLFCFRGVIGMQSVA